MPHFKASSRLAYQGRFHHYTNQKQHRKLRMLCLKQNKKKIDKLEQEFVCTGHDSDLYSRDHNLSIMVLRLSMG